MNSTVTNTEPRAAGEAALLNIALMDALEKASEIERVAKELSCCKSVREATGRGLYTKLATAVFDFHHARDAARQLAKECV